MAKVKKFGMGGMNLNTSSRRAPPPPPPRPIQRSGLGGFNSPAGQPVRAVPVQAPNTSGAPAGLAAMGGGAGLSQAQLSGLRNNLGPQSAPANAAAMVNDIHTGMGSRPSSVGGFSSPAGQPVQVPNTSGTPAGLGAMGGYSGPIPQSRAMTDSETAAHTAAFDKMKADVAALPKMTGFGNIQPVKAQQSPMGMKKGGSVKSSASKRADGCCVKGKTRGKMM